MAESKGTVNFYKKGKGFGFIREEGGKDRKDDIFVHFSDVEAAGLKTLKPDQKIEYDIGSYDRKIIIDDPENEGQKIESTEESFKAVNLKLIE